MSRNGGAYGRTLPIDKIVDPLWDTSAVKDLCNDMGRERRDLRRLVHHRAASRQSGHDLAHDLVDRPVPRCNHADDTDCLAPDRRPSTLSVLEGVGLERLDPGLQVKETRTDMQVLGEFRGRAELLDERVRQVLLAVCEARQNAPQQIDSLLARGPRK
jgi:hypothetical protein